MYYPVCGMMHIKEPLLLIGKSSPCCCSGLPLSLSECSVTLCLTPYNRKQYVLSASLNKTFPSCSLGRSRFFFFFFFTYETIYRDLQCKLEFYFIFMFQLGELIIWSIAHQSTLLTISTPSPPSMPRKSS